MGRSSRQKINKETAEVNHTLNQLDLTDIYRTFHLTVAEYMIFTTAYETLSRIDHMVGHKKVFNKFKIIENMFSIFSHHSAIKLEIN